VDPALQERTFNLIQSSVRNQDLIYFFRGFAVNPKVIKALREFFEKNYKSVGFFFLGLLYVSSLGSGGCW
jgi:aminopeptidase 2